MQTCTLTSKGQVTIPVDMRRRLNLSTGDRIGFEWMDSAVRLVKREHQVEAAFGLIQGNRAASDEEMEQAVRGRAAAAHASA